MTTIRLSLILPVIIAGCGTITPKPFTDAELQSMAQGRLANIVSPEQEPVTGKIGLYEAMARALKYNLDRQVELKQEALRNRELRLADYDLLPDLVARAQYTSRNNDPGSRSVNIATGTVSGTPTRSSDAKNTNGDLTLSWNILDFGISYARSKQKADEVLIALEQRRAATNRVIEDTRTAYFRVVAAQRLLNEVRSLKAQGLRALRSSSRVESSADDDPRRQLEFQRDILSNDQALEQLARDLSVAKTQLAALINLPIGQDYTVKMPSRGRHRSDLKMSRDEMILTAMTNRPELREVSYRSRSNEKENTIATLEAIPGLELFLSANFDDNDLLVNGDWVRTGARLSWNLMRTVRLPERRRTIKAGGELLDARALALTQAIAAQVIAARARYRSLHREYHSAVRYVDVQRRLTNVVNRELDAGNATQQEALNERYQLLVAELRMDVAFADMQSAFANMFTSMGLDSYDGKLSGRESVTEMSAILSDWWHARGDHTIK